MKIKLKDIANFSKGKQINGDNLLTSGNYAYLNGGISPSGYWNDYNVADNSITISEGGNSCGYVNYMQSPFWCGAHCYYLYDLKTSNIKYLYYALKSQQDKLMKLRSGACMPNIKKSDLTEFEFEYDFDINNQTVVVDQLNETERLILLRKQQLAKLDELVKSRFIEMFGDLKSNPHNWQYKNFLDVADIDTVMVSDYEKYADFPHIGIDSIEKNTGRLFGYRTIAEDGVISGKYLFTARHIIYSKIRPNLNKVALPDFDGLCSADAYPILPKENVCLRIYLGYVMRSEFFLDYILPFSRRANMPKVNKEQLSGFNLPVPDIELQRQFAAFVEQIDKTKFEIQKSLEKLETLKKALMQKYFG